MTLWLTSDQHFGHANIIKYEKRPFLDTKHMEDELVRLHNARVASVDEVWHLGDFSFDSQEVKRILGRLNGRHYLVAGNHDRCHKMHKYHLRASRRYLKNPIKDEPGFEMVCLNTYFLGFQVSHLPYSSPSQHDQRYSEWRPHDDGHRWLLHGHVHSAWKIKGRMINVGVDVNNFAPISLEEVAEIRRNAKNTH